MKEMNNQSSLKKCRFVSTYYCMALGGMQKLDLLIIVIDRSPVYLQSRESESLLTHCPV